jgi:hypothetical protein
MMVNIIEEQVFLMEDNPSWKEMKERKDNQEESLQ